MVGIEISSLAHLLDEAEAALAEGWSLPYAWIGDPVLHSFETRVIYERSWQAVALESALEPPGTRIVCKVGRVPVVVVRGSDGVLRGFVNVCRHRGYPVAQEEGCAGHLTCKYHGWVYELDGRVRAAPGLDDVTHDLGLRPVRLEIWRGVVFVNVDAGAPSFLESYPALETATETAAFDLSLYRPHSTSIVDIACDWKLLFDNTAECYHCPTMHAATLSTLYEATGFEAATWQGGVRHARAMLAGTSNRHHSIQLFPGTMLLMDPVMGMVSWFHATGPGTTRLVVHYLAAPDAEAHEVEHFVSTWADTLAEDKQILERQMVGVTCGQIKRGRLVPSREESVPGVQALILAAYREGLDA